jgi:hypothetical protein
MDTISHQALWWGFVLYILSAIVCPIGVFSAAAFKKERWVKFFYLTPLLLAVIDFLLFIYVAYIERGKII